MLVSNQVLLIWMLSWLYIGGFCCFLGTLTGHPKKQQNPPTYEREECYNSVRLLIVAIGFSALKT